MRRLTYSEVLVKLEKAELGRALQRGTWGLEKESQRVTTDGQLAQTMHPSVFGDKLAHPSITTDFAESQLEFITPPMESLEEVYRSLHLIHDEAEAGLGEELLWPLSMPPGLPPESHIQIAHFPDTPEGRRAQGYRESLVHRYGKKPQMISGLHYNFAFSPELLDHLSEILGIHADREERHDTLYLAMTRNFLRYRWLLLYLYGASPTYDRSYADVVSKELGIISRCCPPCAGCVEEDLSHATSLRVSRFGYSNSIQRKFKLSYNSMSEHLDSYRTLLNTEVEAYRRMGLYRQGKQIQLNYNVLQKESELYTPIRLKQITDSGESVLTALQKRGVRYVEVRVLDLNPYERVGISLQQLRFMHVFLLYCLLESSPSMEEEEWSILQDLHHKVSLYGRTPLLELTESITRSQVRLRDWGQQLFGKFIELARLLDESGTNSSYVNTVEQEQRKLNDISLLPSSRIIKDMEDRQLSYLMFGVQLAETHRLREARVGGTPYV